MLDGLEERGREHATSKHRGAEVLPGGLCCLGVTAVQKVRVYGWHCYIGGEVHASWSYSVQWSAGCC